MSDDKRLKSTEIIYNDRKRTEIMPENQVPADGSDQFRQNFVNPQGQPGGMPAQGQSGRETQIHFGSAVPEAAPNAPGGSETGGSGSGGGAAASLIGQALGMPAGAVQQLIGMLPQTEIVAFAAKMGVAPPVIEQIQGALQNPAEGLPAGFSTSRPTTGWLVVIKGPGRGNSLPLSFGRNDVGRDADQAVPLVFGDEQISRRSQLTITFDPRSGKFLCTPGEGTRNLCYISNEPLVSPMVLSGPTDIEVGMTTLRFIPFCDETCQWTAE
ncbi:MAG: FHA domain-containing protein [Pseudomonadota bacterium]